MSSLSQDRLLEHQFDPRPHRHRREIPRRGSARHPLPAGDQGPRQRVSATGCSAGWATTTSSSAASRCTMASPSSAGCRCARTIGSTGRRMARRAMSASGSNAGSGWRTSMSPPAATFRTATLNPKFGQKLDFIERMTRWSEALRLPDDHGRRLQRRAARMRRLEPQAAAQRGQPHAGRGRGADPAAGEQRLGRPRPPFLSRRRSGCTPGGATARPTGRGTTAAGGSTICGRPPTSAKLARRTSSTSPAATGRGPRTMSR